MQLNIPDSPKYWKTFYVIQSTLLVECPEKYSAPKSSYDSNELNDKAHGLAILIHNIYEKI